MRGVEVYGMPAYVVDKLLETGLYGNTREKVLERIVVSWISEKFDFLKYLGVSLEEAKIKGYIPIKTREN